MFAKTFCQGRCRRTSQRRIENFLWKVLAGDKLKPMKLPARLLLAALTLSIGALSPIVPPQVSFPKSEASDCCAIMNAGACHRCPGTMSDATSASASSCCTTQSECLALYFSKTTTFSRSMHLLGVVNVSDDHVTIRTHRPSVPPPRGMFS